MIAGASHAGRRSLGAALSLGAATAMVTRAAAQQKLSEATPDLRETHA